MGNLPKKEVAYPKREIGIDKLQKTTKSWTWTIKFTNRLQKIPIDYKMSDVHYNVHY